MLKTDHSQLVTHDVTTWLPRSLGLQMNLMGFLSISALEIFMLATGLLGFKHLAKPCLQFGWQYELCSLKALNAALLSTKGIRRVRDRERQCDVDILWRW